MNSNIVLGVTGLGNGDLKVIAAEILLSKNSFDFRLKCYNVLISSNDLILSRMENYLSNIDEFTRLSYLDSYNCRPSELLSYFLDEYDFEEDTSDCSFNLFNDVLFDKFFTIADNDGGFLELIFENCNCSLSLNDIETLLVSRDFIKHLSNYSSDISSFDFDSFNKFYFSNYKSSFDKLKTYLEMNVNHLV